MSDVPQPLAPLDPPSPEPGPPDPVAAESQGLLRSVSNNIRGYIFSPGNLGAGLILTGSMFLPISIYPAFAAALAWKNGVRERSRVKQLGEDPNSAKNIVKTTRTLLFSLLGAAVGVPFPGEWATYIGSALGAVGDTIAQVKNMNENLQHHLRTVEYQQVPLRYPHILQRLQTVHGREFIDKLEPKLVFPPLPSEWRENEEAYWQRFIAENKKVMPIQQLAEVLNSIEYILTTTSKHTPDLSKVEHQHLVKDRAAKYFLWEKLSDSARENLTGKKFATKVTVEEFKELDSTKVKGLFAQHPQLRTAYLRTAAVAGRHADLKWFKMHQQEADQLLYQDEHRGRVFAAILVAPDGKAKLEKLVKKSYHTDVSEDRFVRDVTTADLDRLWAAPPEREIAYLHQFDTEQAGVRQNWHQYQPQVKKRELGSPRAANFLANKLSRRQMEAVIGRQYKQNIAPVEFVTIASAPARRSKLESYFRRVDISGTQIPLEMSEWWNNSKTALTSPEAIEFIVSKEAPGNADFIRKPSFDPFKYFSKNPSHRDEFLNSRGYPAPPEVAGKGGLQFQNVAELRPFIFANQHPMDLARAVYPCLTPQERVALCDKNFGGDRELKADFLNLSPDAIAAVFARSEFGAEAWEQEFLVIVPTEFQAAMWWDIAPNIKMQKLADRRERLSFLYTQLTPQERVEDALHLNFGTDANLEEDFKDLNPNEISGFFRTNTALREQILETLPVPTGYGHWWQLDPAAADQECSTPAAAAFLYTQITDERARIAAMGEPWHFGTKGDAKKDFLEPNEDTDKKVLDRYKTDAALTREFFQTEQGEVLIADFILEKLDRRKLILSQEQRERERQKQVSYRKKSGRAARDFLVGFIPGVPEWLKNILNGAFAIEEVAEARTEAQASSTAAASTPATPHPPTTPPHS